MAVARKTTEVGERSERSARQGTGRAKTSGRTKKTGTSKNGKKSAEVRKKNRDTINEYRDHQAFETGITIAVVAIVSLLLYLSYFSLAGKAGMVIGGLMFGFFGWFAWFLPISVLVGYVFLQINAGDKRIMRKSVGVVGIILSLSALTDLIFNNDTIYEYYKINHVTHTGYFDAMFLACKNVMEWGRFNGGLVGRAFGAIFSVILGRVGATLILFALFFFFVYIFYGIEAMAKLRKRNAYRQEMGEIYAQVKEDEEYREPSYRVFTFSENKNRRQMPMRTLEKVPKVQTFDLRGQAEFFKEDEKKKRSVFENENEKYFEEEAEDENIADANPVDTNTLDGNTLDANTLDVNTVDEDAAKDKMADIPIYRNELEEKFGQKKDAALIPSQQMVREEEHFGLRESAFDRFEKRKEEIREQNIKMEPLEEISFSDHDRDSLEEMTADGFAYDEGNAVENGSVDYREEIETTFAEEKVEAFVEKTEVETSDEKDEMEAVVSPFDMDDSFEEMEEDSRLDDFEDDSVMIMDDFVPQKPMNSFAPKEETDRITLDSAEQDPSAGVERLTVSSGNGNSGRKHPDMGNGSRVFSDFSSVTKHASDGRAEGKREVPEEKKIEKPYEFPKIDLLAMPKKSAGAASDEELRRTATKLQETLESFNVKVKMGAVTCGPTVTRYELLPEQGVRVNKITNLADDLKLSLAAPSIRIEAPIPGKAAVGIEVPNAEASPVSFRELLEGEQFEKSKSPLTFAVGKDIAGKLIMADIAKMPHLLIAGATGSGKSVCINTLIMSILYKADPKDVKLIMIDPKVVELSCYNGIPHLFCPVVTDPKEAAASLNWAVREMMDRYNKFKELNVRNISGYNEKIKTVENAAEAGYEKMPYLVVIVDEFADLMMVASKDVEDAVCRLAQLARAAGIHLVLATQRPSVNVITGVIKANIPSRIAFSVSSTIDSRTILDKGGAEKLLGKGDMLFFPSGYTEPVRVQGAFVSDKEVNDVVEFLCDTNDTPEYNHAVTEIMEEPQEEMTVEKKPQSDRDEYFADAGRFVIESERAAAGQLQRHFSIGFNRAGRIIDQLEKAGVVGPAAGTKPRNVLMTLDEFEMMLNGGEISSGMDMMEEAL